MLVGLPCDCSFLSVAMILTILLSQSADRHESTATDFSNVQTRSITATQAADAKRRIYWGYFVAECRILCEKKPANVQLYYFKFLLFTVTWIANKPDVEHEECHKMDVSKIYKLYSKYPDYFVHFFLCYQKMTNSTKLKK